MVSFLVIYGTGEGQTAKVATSIIDVLTDRGHDATAVNADEIWWDLIVDDFDAILVGASIHAGKHQPTVRGFVQFNRDVLATKPTAFFRVSLSSADERGQAQVVGYVEEFVDDTDWYPGRIGLFGGALRYSQYGFLKRLVIKQIAKKPIPDEDTSDNTEFTDWNEVEAFAADIAAFVEGGFGITPPSIHERELNK